MNFIDKRNYKEDHFVARMPEDAKTGKKKLHLKTPSMIVHVADEKELKLQLDHYKKPFIKDLVPDSTAARKNLVENIRPALRYWCAKFGVEVPSWLKDESEWVKLNDQKKMALFGTAQLNIQEFRKFKNVDMEHGDGQDSK